MNAHEPPDFTPNIPMSSHQGLPLTPDISPPWHSRSEAADITASNTIEYSYSPDERLMGHSSGSEITDGAGREKLWTTPRDNPFKRRGPLAPGPFPRSVLSFHLMRDEQSAVNDSETFVDSGVSVTGTRGQHLDAPVTGVPAHLDSAYREKRGRDDDFNRLVTAFNFRDHHEREIERIFEARPDLLALKQADSESDDDNDESLPLDAANGSETIRTAVAKKAEHIEALPDFAATAQMRLQGRSEASPAIPSMVDRHDPIRGHIMQCADASSFS